MIDGFQCLRHDTVVRRDNEHDDIRDIRAARAHGTERCVTGRVEERDLRQFLFAFWMRHGNRVSADVLRDAAGLACGDIRLANHVEQRCFAVVNVTHDGDDRRARLEVFRLVLDIELNFFFSRVNHAAAALAFFNFKTETVFRAKLLRNFFVNRLIHVRKNAQFHQISDDFEGLLFQLRGEFAHDNRRLDDDDFAACGRDKFGLRCGRRFRLLARRRRGLAAAGRPLKWLSGIGSSRRALTRRRQFD